MAQCVYSLLWPVCDISKNVMYMGDCWVCVVLLCNTLFSFKTARSDYLNLLSPTLFNIFLERIMTDTSEDHEGTVSLLLYVSLAHILLIAPNWQELSDCLFVFRIYFVCGFEEKDSLENLHIFSCFVWWKSVLFNLLCVFGLLVFMVQGCSCYRGDDGESCVFPKQQRPPCPAGPVPAVESQRHDPCALHPDAAICWLFWGKKKSLKNQ